MQKPEWPDRRMNERSDDSWMCALRTRGIRAGCKLILTDLTNMYNCVTVLQNVEHDEHEHYEKLLNELSDR